MSGIIWINGFASPLGARLFFWTSSASSRSASRNLDFSPNQIFAPQDDSNRSYGIPVHCSSIKALHPTANPFLDTLLFGLSGNVWANNPGNLGLGGYFWSHSKQFEQVHARILAIYGGSILPQVERNRNQGLSVRCSIHKQ